MSNDSLSVGPISDALTQYQSLAGEALLFPDPQCWQVYVERIGQENLRGVYRGDELLGGLAFYRTAHWFGGNEIATAGISGVAISPAHRGGGHCGRLLRSVLRELQTEGVPLASLYASTQHLYRSVGFEHAGSQTHYSIPITSLCPGPRQLPIHRFSEPPLAPLRQIAEHRARLGNGHLTRTPGMWERLLRPNDGAVTTTYILGDLDEPQAYVILRGGSRDAGVPSPLVSTDVAACTAESLGQLMTLVHDHRSMSDSFEWFGGPNDLLIFLADEQWVTIKDWMRWMLRIVDLPAAIGRRGYPPALEATLDLDIRDECLTENSGRWQVHIHGGEARVERGGHGHLQMDIRALAPLFSSLLSAEQLQAAGVLMCDAPEQIALATAAMAGPSPWLTEIF